MSTHVQAIEKTLLTMYCHLFGVLNQGVSSRHLNSYGVCSLHAEGQGDAAVQSDERLEIQIN